MENFGDYLRAGVDMGLGTDCAPHNLVEEMRKAAVLARIAARDITAVTTSDLFHAATVGGAKALLRDDLGRLAPGMKADLVLRRPDHPADAAGARPATLLRLSRGRPRRARRLYRRTSRSSLTGSVLTLDQNAAAVRLRAAQQRMEALASARDYRGRTADEITPLSLPVLDKAC